MVRRSSLTAINCVRAGYGISCSSVPVEKIHFLIQNYPKVVGFWMLLHRTGHDRPYPLLALTDESPPPHPPSSCTRFLPKTSSPIVAAAVFDNPASQYTRGRTRIPEIVVLPQYTARSRDPLFRRHGKNTKSNTNTHTHKHVPHLSEFLHYIFI